MKRRYIVPMEDDTPLDDILEEMYDLGIFVHTPFNWDDLYEKPEDFLSNYLLEDHNDVCLVDEIGYIPYIDNESINSKKSIIQLFQFEKLKQDLSVDLDEYVIDNLTYEERKNNLSDARAKVIREMYDYKGNNSRKAFVPNTKEEIYNWYIVGFESLDKLEEMFNLADLYDAESAYKIYVEDPIRLKQLDGRRHIKILQYFKAYIDQYGDNDLGTEEYCIGIIVSVLIDLDKPIRESTGDDFIIYKAQQRMYIDLAIDLYEKYYRGLISILLRNYKKAKTDVELELDAIEQKDALNISLKLAKSRLIVDDGLKEKFETIFANVYARINDGHHTLDPFLKAMKEAEANYILTTDNGTKFYPMVVDLLLDIYRFNYVANDDKSDINLLKNSLPLLKNNRYSNEFKSLKSTALYSKIQILDKVKRNQIENYLLHLYYKVLPVNKNALRRFYKQLIFPTNTYSLQAKTFVKELDMTNIPTSTHIRYYSHFIL